MLPWQASGTAQALGFVNGQWRNVDPISDGVGIPALGWGTVPSRAISVQSDVHFFPRHGWAPQASRAYILGTGFSTQLNERLAAQANRVAAEEISVGDAAVEVRDQLSSDPTRWLLPSSSNQGGFHVLGFQDERPALASATMPGLLTESNWYLLTGAPLLVAARRIWRDEVEQKGVLLPEEIFDLDDFEAEVAELLPDIPSHGKLFLEGFEYLD